MKTPLKTRKKLQSLADTSQLASELLSMFESNAVVFLIGDLGVGKTEFVKQLLALRGGATEVMSPTFAISNMYEFSDGAVQHFDLYRLETMDEIETSGLWEALAGSNQVFVEWADRISSADVPKHRPLWILRFSPERNVEIEHRPTRA